MPTDTLHAAKPSLAYAKLVATPTNVAWSQVYNAGNLFASLSLSLAQPEESISLQLIGKEIFNNLEAEFFTLEEKNLNTIKTAITDSIKSVPETVSLSLCLACFKDNILYLFIVGDGRIVMKREAEIGVLLEGHPEKQSTILTASGFVANKDIIVLETKQFSENIQDTTLTSALELALPNDIAEALSPQLHASDDGGQAAIIIVYHGIANNTFATDEEQEETIGESHQALYSDDNDEDDDEEEILHQPERTLPTLPILPKTLPKLYVPQMKRIPHTKKLFLSIIVIIVGLLAISIFLTKQQQDNKQIQELFQIVYVPAQKNYDEGKELESLNQSLSREDFLEAEQLITENLTKFKKGSKEEQQLTALLEKIRAELGGTTNEKKDLLKLKEASDSDSKYLSIEKTTNGISFAQDTNTVYALTKDAITSITKTSTSKKDQIKNDNFWKEPVALSPYQGNMYVLDTEKGVLKFVASTGKPSSYFPGSAPDLSNATAMAIDGSIWVLLKDGTILKYTRGQADSFKIQGLDQTMTNAIKIFTGIDVSNIYVLDKGTGRVVIFDKKGSFQKAYAAHEIKDAKDFDVLEKDKKIIILSDNKVWELPL